MATAKTAPAETVATPIDWDGVDGALVLDGADIVDKSELVNRPFLITGIKSSVNSRQVHTMFVEATPKDGDPVTFTDSSSTGVREQLMKYLVTINKGDVLDEWVDVKIVAPKGLRVSKYTATDNRGKEVPAKTYYLTTSGRRA
jgi:hypothetical protein